MNLPLLNRRQFLIAGSAIALTACSSKALTACSSKDQADSSPSTPSTASNDTSTPSKGGNLWIPPILEGTTFTLVANIKTKDNSGMLLGGDSSKQLKEILSLLATTSIGGTLAGFGFGLLTPYALVGGAIGGIAGFVLGIGWLASHKGQPVNIPSGTKLVIILENDVAVSYFGI